MYVERPCVLPKKQETLTQARVQSKGSTAVPSNPAPKKIYLAPNPIKKDPASISKTTPKAKPTASTSGSSGATRPQNIPLDFINYRA